MLSFVSSFLKVMGLSECLVDVEYKSRAVAAEAIVETHVHALLELPAVAHAGVGQNVAQPQAAVVGEHLGGSQPHHDAVAAVDVLPHRAGRGN